MIAQLIYVALTLMSLGMNFAKHGEQKTGKHDGWSSFVSTAIIYAILYWGGFFDVFLKTIK